MLRCLIVLCVGTLLAVESAPAPQQNTIDFLLDLNQDVLDKEEVQASVKPISQAQVGTTTERNGAREPAPVFEDQQADVQEIPSPEQGPTASQLNRDREEVPEDREEQDVQEEDSRSNSDDESEEKDQSSDNKKEDQDGKDQGRNEDTTIRVYGPEDENDENDESLQQKEQQDQPQETEQKVEPEVQRQPQEDFRRPQEDAQQPEVLVSQHADTVKQFDEAVDREIDQVTIPDSLDDHQEIEVKPDQLFNHGSIVFDKSTFADEDLPSTTPFSNKKWNHDHGPPAGFGPWHPKFPGGFPGHPPHADGESGRPPFFGMPPFNGPPPTRFDGPPHWHLHNHSHDHRDWHHDHQHDHDHDHDHGFHGHGFHRGGPWKWNRT